MTPAITAEFIRRIPKTDLHLHLDGSLRIPTLVELARRERVKLPSYTEEGLRKLVFKKHYRSLPEYLRGFTFTVAVLQSPENLERAAFEMAEDNLAEGVRYIEVRFAPQLHCRAGFSIEQVVHAVCKGLDRAKHRHNRRPAVTRGEDIPFEYGIIACALRHFNEQYSPYYRQILHVMSYAPRKEVFAAASLEMARAAVEMARHKGLQVVGFDLAGEESGYPAEAHKAAYQFAHSHFLKKTVHAGEAYGPESIFQAITECHANRIGHGTFLFAWNMIRDPSIEDPRAYARWLAEYVASQRITLEVCLTSNLQTTPSIRLQGTPAGGGPSPRHAAPVSQPGHRRLQGQLFPGKLHRQARLRAARARPLRAVGAGNPGRFLAAGGPVGPCFALLVDSPRVSGHGMRPKRPSHEQQ
jgi:adenosine deaminase